MEIPTVIELCDNQFMIQGGHVKVQERWVLLGRIGRMLNNWPIFRDLNEQVHDTHCPISIFMCLDSPDTYSYDNPVRYEKSDNQSAFSPSSFGSGPSMICVSMTIGVLCFIAQTFKFLNCLNVKDPLWKPCNDVNFWNISGLYLLTLGHKKNTKLTEAEQALLNKNGQIRQKRNSKTDKR